MPTGRVLALALLPINPVNPNGSDCPDRHDPLHSASRKRYCLDAMGLKIPLQRILGIGVARDRFVTSGQSSEYVAELGVRRILEVLRYHRLR